MEKEKWFTGPLKKKKNGLRCRTTISLGAKMRRVVLDRGISGWSERREKTRATCCCTMPGYLSLFSGFRVRNMLETPILYTGLHFRGNSYEILCRNLDQISPYEFITLAKTRDFHYSLSLALLPFLLPCITRGGRSLHTSWNETILATGTRFCRDSKIPGG